MSFSLLQITLIVHLSKSVVCSQGEVINLNNRTEDIPENQKDRYIDYQTERVANFDLDNRAMYLVLEDFLKTQQQMLDKLSSLESSHEVIQMILQHNH